MSLSAYLVLNEITATLKSTAQDCKQTRILNFLDITEFFHADSGKGLGASHQTGWTG
ncbi:hypothetical protein JCM3765_007857, partial [Sporobolomyces pararoseus]